MRSLKLSDGTTYAVEWCNADKGVFHINLETDESFMDIAAKFGNPELTRTIRVDFGYEEERIYEGYTVLRSITVDSWRTGTTLVVLLLPSMIEAA